MLHLYCAVRSPIAYTDGLIIHPQSAAGTDDGDFPLEILPESEFSSMPMKFPLGYTCREAEGETVAFDLLPHRFLYEGDLDSIRFDLLGQGGEISPAPRGDTRKRLAHGNDYWVYYLYQNRERRYICDGKREGKGV